MSRQAALASWRLSSLALLVTACGCSKLMPSGGDGGAASSTEGTAAGASLAILNGFEGEIDAVVKEKKPGEAPIPLEVYVRSDRVRLDVPQKVAQTNSLGEKAYVIFDSPAKKLSVVSDAQKQVIVLDLTKTGEQLKGFKGLGVPPTPHGATPPQQPTAKVTKTGKFDTVAGYKCENWEVTSDHRETTICVAEEGVSWFHIPITGIPTEKLWAAELLDGKHFPLRLVVYAKDGTTEESRIEVTKIDKKAPAAPLFEVPPAYRVVDLGQLFQGLAGLPSGLPTPGALPHAKGH